MDLPNRAGTYRRLRELLKRNRSIRGHTGDRTRIHDARTLFKGAIRTEYWYSHFVLKLPCSKIRATRKNRACAIVIHLQIDDSF
jgi:hypothetical protein